MAATTKPAMHRTREVVLKARTATEREVTVNLSKCCPGGRLDRGAMSVMAKLHSAKRIRTGIGAAKLLADDLEIDLTCYIDDVIERRLPMVADRTPGQKGAL